MADRPRTEWIDLADLQQLVPSYTREEELRRWERNGPSGDAVASIPADQPDLVLLYAEHADGVIDVFLPGADAGGARPWPLVFAVHGGSFRSDWDRSYLRPLARLLNRHGLVVALPEFRRVGGLGGWPVIAYDVRDALAAAPAGIAAAVPGYVDPSRPVVVLGHSSGGHLGTWAGLHLGPDSVARIIALAPSFALEFNARIRKHNSYIQDLLGGDPSGVPEAYSQADIFRLATGEVPLHVLQGTADLQLTIEASRRAAARLDGTPGFSYTEVPDADHFDLINPRSKAFVEAVLPLLAP